MNRSSVNSLEFRLVPAAARGDREAQRQLFELHREAAYRVAFRVTGREADALDVVQDAFIRAFARLNEFQGGSRFKTWLLRIVTNRALDQLRARKVRLAASLSPGDEDEPAAPAIAAESRAPDAGLEQTELNQRLHAALEGLPPEQRAAFALHAGGEMTYEQIAEALGVPIGTVMSRIYHARRRLRGVLADLAPGDAAENSRRISNVE